MIQLMQTIAGASSAAVRLDPISPRFFVCEWVLPILSNVIAFGCQCKDLPVYDDQTGESWAPQEIPKEA